MQYNKTKLKDVFIIEPTTYTDSRGFFLESFNQKKFNEITGKTKTFCQDNHSMSHKGALRGLHYQLPPNAQAKLVRVIQGEVFDVVVDLRLSSDTYGQWLGITLSAENKKQLWIPEGFAHGFLTLSKTAEFVYKTTNYYAPESEKCILWHDENINIQWPKKIDLIISEKDQQGLSFLNAPKFK